VIFWISVLDSITQSLRVPIKNTDSYILCGKHWRFCRLSSTCSPHCIWRKKKKPM